MLDRNQLWIWGHPINFEFQQPGWGLKKESKVSVREGAEYLGTPNTILVSYHPESWNLHLTESFEQVIWNISPNKAADGTYEYLTDARKVAELTRQCPAIVGAIIDDLDTVGAEAMGIKADHIEKVHDAVRAYRADLPLYGVLYAHTIAAKDYSNYVKHLDGIAFWMWESAHLLDLDAHLTRCEALADGKPIMMGIYLYDYGVNADMPLDRLQYQCDRVAQYLAEGRITGAIILANCNIDIAIEQAAQVREWVQANFA